MRALLVAASAALLGILVAGAAEGGSPRATPGSKNPHGDPTACTSCHEASSDADGVGAALPVVATCRSCHPTADMHPVGMPPNKVHVPKDWPLEDGKVTCATCHVEPAHGAAEAALPSPWHRGGPYPSVTRFCYACHEAEAYTRSDPHHPAKPRDAGDSTCAACHTGMPQAGAGLAESRLRAKPEEVCTGTCHTATVHAGLKAHLGEEVPAERVAALPGVITLQDGRVACFSCHEVHEPAADPGLEKRKPLPTALREQALEEDWSSLAGAELVWPGVLDLTHPPLLALPTSDGSLCRACHGDGP